MVAGMTVIGALAGRADEAKLAQAAPVPFQPLEYYASLWQQSLFTTAQQAIPAPTVSFADQLTLAGVYEVDGKSVAVVMDKATSQVSEVESNSGVDAKRRLLKVEQGGTAGQARVLLQIGSQVGWLAFPMGDAVTKADGRAPVVLHPRASAPAVPITIAPTESRVPENLPLPVPDIRTEAPKPVPMGEDAPVPPQ